MFVDQKVAMGCVEAHVRTNRLAAISTCCWAGQVDAGGAKSAARTPGRTLFLCYPPPGQPMAAECLAKYRRAAGRAGFDPILCSFRIHIALKRHLGQCWLFLRLLVSR